MKRLGILGSTRGTSLLALVDAAKSKQLSASIEVVISNKAESGILQKAAAHAIPHYFVDGKNLSADCYHQKLTELLQKHHVDLVVLIGYMRILSTDFVNSWSQKIINTHPSLLPDFAGLMDLAVHKAILAAGKRTTGCTIHYVTKDVDSGPILLQKTCAVSLEDTAEALKERVQALESQALIQAINQLVSF